MNESTAPSVARENDNDDQMEGVYEYPPAAVMTADERARPRVPKRERELGVAVAQQDEIEGVTFEQEDQVLF